MAYKTLIPSLLTLDSNKLHMNNMYISSDFSFYPASNIPGKFHYTERCSGNIDVPTIYDMRSEYFTKYDNSWYYDRQSRILPLTLSYNTATKTFLYTKRYAIIPFGIGGVVPPGELIADIINYHLFLKGIIVLRGIAYTYENKTICITGPGFNGKTTLLDHMLAKGAEYIADDLLVLNLNNNTVYPSCPFIRRHAWQKKRSLESLHKKISVVQEPRNIDMIYCVENSTNKNYTPEIKTFQEFLLLNDRYILKNRLVRSMIFTEGTWDTVSHILSTPTTIPHQFVAIKNFDYGILEKI